MNNKGFTLLELVVVMAIISIMCTVIITGYSGQRDVKALSLGEKQIVNNIRITQGRTYNILKINGSFPEGGYGIRFTKDSNKYMIFADSDSDGKYDGVGEDFEEVELPGNVEVSNLKEDGITPCDPCTTVDIVFQPPYGKVLIDGSEKAGLSFINLEIEISNGSDTKTIQVNSSRSIK